MTPNDKLSPLNPKMASAVFFAIYALMFLLFAKYTLLSLRDGMLLPLFPSLLIAPITGAFAGWWFGSVLAQPGKWFRAMIFGILLAVIALLLASLAVFVHAYFYDNTMASRLTHWQDFFIFYGVILASMTLIIGLWLIPITGLAAVYFNKRFLPGLLAADQLRTEKSEAANLPDKKND